MSKKTETADEREDREFKQAMQSSKDLMQKVSKDTGIHDPTMGSKLFIEPKNKNVSSKVAVNRGDREFNEIIKDGQKVLQESIDLMQKISRETGIPDPTKNSKLFAGLEKRTVRGMTATELEDREFKETMQSTKDLMQKISKDNDIPDLTKNSKTFTGLENKNEPIKAETQTKPKTGLFARAWNATKNLFSSSSKNQSTESNKVMTSALKTQDNRQTKPEDLSASRKDLKQDLTQIQSMRKERAGNALTDEKFKQILKDIEVMTKEQIATNSQAFNAALKKEHELAATRGKDVNKTVSTAQSIPNMKVPDKAMAKPEDLSESRNALKQDYKQWTSLKHKRENRPLTDTDRAQFTRNLKIIDTMTKEQLTTKSQEFSTAIKNELKLAADITKVKDAYQTGAKIQSNLQKSIAGHIHKINQNTANYKGPNAALPNNKKSTGTGKTM
jgi:hypothetical protein